MSTELVAILIIMIAGFIGLFFTLRRRGSNEGGQSLLMLQNQLDEMRRTMDAKLGESTRLLQTQFGESARIVRDVTERLTKLDETNRQVVGFADQLKNLQDILKNPKQRGVLGEYYLETLLKNVLPPGSYQMQYPFGNGEIVDAAVFVKDKVIPVDSKFSLENYNRLAEARDPSERDRLEKLFVNDLKLRIIETAKYIRPAENTTDFAFMFIPHEAIYYDLLVNKVGAVTEDTENLIQRAAGKYKVIIVSPTSFLAYLQTVLQGLKALQIEEQAQEIIKRVEDLGKHVGKYEEFMRKLGVQMGTAVNTYNIAYKELGKVDKDVLRITGKSAEIEPMLVTKPDSGDSSE
ncbi:DNA recombination protein RmuC [Candidatus Parcubacteria bacterium]|nr:MAG: DNA recombination protein RmuC [Candidatus Parcubacteria bacterium]